MKSDKRQTYILIGVGLIAVAAVLLYVCLSQPLFVAEPAATVEDSVITSAYTAAPVSEEDAAAALSAQNTQAAADAGVVFPVNLNTATMDELMAIDGIGEKRATLILAYRDTLGGYTSVEQIKNISGIGDTVYEKIAPYLTV